MKHTCEFCSQQCKYVSQDVDEQIYGLPLWFTCKTCNVGYEKHLNGNLIMTRFYAYLNGKTYSLDLIHSFKEARIIYIPDNVEDTIVVVLNIKDIDFKITPNNCHSKIETYITFS